MTLTPLLVAPSVVKLHVAAILSASALGAVQLAAPKGTVPHRALGYAYLALMLLMAVSAFFIREPGGKFAFSHLFIPAVIIIGALGLWFAKQSNIRGHRMMMTMLFAGTTIGAGIFAVLRGRIVHSVLFGG